MKKITLAFCFFLFVFEFGFCQNPLVKQWDKRFGGTNEDWLYSFQQTSDGGYILGGVSNSGLNGDKSQVNWAGSQDFWIVKMDTLGNKQFDKDFGGTSIDILYSLQHTGDGGFILGGVSYSDSSGDVTQPTQDTSSNIGYKGDFWIVKINSLGNKEWDKRFGGVVMEFLYSLQQTADGGYILGGCSGSGISGDKTQNTRGGFDYWIVKTDSSGNKQWDKDLGGTRGDVLSSLQPTKDGGYILGGYSSSDSSGDKTQDNWDTTLNSFDYWIVKTDSLGNKIWDKRFGGTKDDLLKSLQQTADGGYILGGISHSDIGGDKTQAMSDTFPVGGPSDFWILKIDSNGFKQWDKKFGGLNTEYDFGNITQTTDGGYLLAGISYSNICGDKTEDNLGVEQTWVLKIDSFGIKQWDKTIFTTGHEEVGFAIQIDDGCYVVANSTKAGIGGYKTQANWDMNEVYVDYWIIKFCDSTSSTGINNFQSSISNFNIFPNPTNDFINISFTLKEEKNVSVEVYDLFGRKVLQTPNSKLPAKIDMRSFTNGIYVMEIKTGEGIYREKVVKE